MSEQMAEAAAWVAETIGYPVECTMPDRPMPEALWQALVDHVHADKSGRWHGNSLDREDVESWLADEAGRPLTTPTTDHRRPHPTCADDTSAEASK